MKESEARFLGFPVPLLGLEPVRLPVIYDDGDLIALIKPAGVLVQADPWFPRLPVLVEAIRHQAEIGKQEFVRRGIGESGLWSITDLDPELQGPVLFSRDRERAEQLKSEVGSGSFQFTFRFLTNASPGESDMECDLPLARHRTQAKMLVSHTTGKKSQTRFQCQSRSGSFSQWIAISTFPRRHQIFVHALERGLPILADTIYARQKPLLLSRLKRTYQPKKDLEERPLYPGPACFLESIQSDFGLKIDYVNPAKWGGLLKQLDKLTHV